MFLSTPQNSHKYYDLTWAENTFRSFIGQYARAWQLFRLTHRIPEGQIISWLSSDQERWERFKKIVKRIDRWHKMHKSMDPYEYGTQVLSTIYYTLAKEFDFYDEKRAYCLDAGIS